MTRHNGRGWRQRRGKLAACALCLTVLFWASRGRFAVWAQVPIVSPDAVSTPVASQNVNHAVVETPPVYMVKAGDTLWKIALEVGIDLALMPCTVAPDFTPDQPLVIGNMLALLPPDQWCHTVQPGETLVTIAAQYGVTPAQIYALAWNQLAQVPLAAVQVEPGRQLRIPLDATGATTAAPTDTASFLTWMLRQPVNTSPFAVLAVGGPFAEELKQARQVQQGLTARMTSAQQPGVVPANWPYGSGHFTWPLAGWLTQGYRYDHRALDIASPAGTPVTAADRGVVRRAGWNNQGYGLFVIVDHNIDYVTLYAHLSEVLVQEGQVVAQGAVLGKVGSTGNSTGPHLHFEIRDFGRLTNPLELLSNASVR
ncbi:MAG: peptidoglycan DD-metalloendopeptidase family protein [Caldilineaceae bacterium]|nr:peptidoglycan DD-metalloendopeptidase family protein [Caldilineaceae bacterium]